MKKKNKQSTDSEAAVEMESDALPGEQSGDSALPGEQSADSALPGEQSADSALPGEQSGDYTVGLVSGSLFKKKKKSKATGLSALFTNAPTTTVLFQPAPKPVPQSSEPKAETETPEVKAQSSKKRKQKEKTQADEKLENRESSLQQADEDERGQLTQQRKKQRKAGETEDDKPTVEEYVQKRQRVREQKQEDGVRNQRTVFVGNLPIGCTKKMLQNLFRDKGAVESIRFRSVVREDPAMSRKVAVIQRKVHPKKQSINAYVVFKDEEGVVKALERNGMEIEKDFHIRVDRVKSGSAVHDHKRSVFVGNLSFEIKELSVRRHFEECGDVEAVRLVRDPNSGLGKGFGYVLFESADSVQLALKLDSSKLDGRSVRVKRSVKKEKIKKTGDSKGAPGRGGAKGKNQGQNKGPNRASGRPERGGARGGFKNFKKSSGSFKGEMTDPNKKTKKKPMKNKGKPKKAVHI